MRIKMTADAATELEEMGFDAVDICKKIADRIMSEYPPKYAQDTADNISIYHLELSWIRDNINEEITILTRQEAKELDNLDITILLN